MAGGPALQRRRFKGGASGLDRGAAVIGPVEQSQEGGNQHENRCIDGQSQLARKFNAGFGTKEDAKTVEYPKPEMIIYCAVPLHLL